ncbi:hypothetical protein ACTXT7_000263 [Hymenolepis weldensis]
MAIKPPRLHLTAMTFNGKSPLFILFLVLNHLFFPILAAELNRLQEWEGFPSEPVDCGKYPVENSEAFQRTSSECTYTVTLKLKLFPNELAVLCARQRQTLPCLITNGEGKCEIDPMEFSDFELYLLDIINRELQMRIYRLQQQQYRGLKVSLDTRSEVQQIISDNLYWLCSRKCSNSTCEFNAELKPQRRAMGNIPRLTSLITNYPKPRRGRPIEIYFPIGSDEISHLLQKNAPFRHLAVSSLPLTKFQGYDFIEATEPATQ